MYMYVRVHVYLWQNEGKDSYDAITDDETSESSVDQPDESTSKHAIIELLVCILAFIGRVSGDRWREPADCMFISRVSGDWWWELADLYLSVG